MVIAGVFVIHFNHVQIQSVVRGNQRGKRVEAGRLKKADFMGLGHDRN